MALRHHSNAAARSSARIVNRSTRAIFQNLAPPPVNHSANVMIAASPSITLKIFEAPRPETNFYPLTIAEVKPETDTAACITFAVSDELKDKFNFIQGQFLTLKADIDGEEVRRSYSICSSVNDGHMRVGIKRVKGGKFSNYANDHFTVGQQIEVMPP